MKSWTILALLVAICAVFLGVGHTEETAKLDVLEEQPREDTENEEQLVDSFLNRENEDGDDDDDDGSENALDSENNTPSDDEDQPSMFKRTPGWGRRRRRRRRRFRVRVRLRRLRFPRIRIRLRRVHDNLKNLCKMRWSPEWVQRACGFLRCVKRDEEAPRETNDETTDEVDKDSWLNEE